MKTTLTTLLLSVLGFQLSAQVSFTLSSSPTVGSAPQCVISTDVNGDGKVDLISASQDYSALSVLTNDGSGYFALASFPSVGNQPFSVAAADVNSDGKVDLISANWGADTLSVLTNDGGGGFATAGTYSVGNGPITVVAADVNGDSKPDLISANFYDNTVSVLTNNGSSGYVTSGTYAVGTQPITVTAADFNKDGRMDLACANQIDGTLSVLTNNGNGSFVTAGTYASGIGAFVVAAADVNGDGWKDLICGNQQANTLSVLTNNGSVGFVASATYPLGSLPECLTVADVNGDSKVDLIWGSQNANTISVLTNNGSGDFSAASTNVVGIQAQGVAAADVNGDGKVDLISANYRSSSLSILTNATPFTPSFPPIIAGFNPTTALIGASVTLSGSNFSPVASNNIVYFGAVRAAVITARTDNLTVTVPMGATYAPITETVNGLTAYSDEPFLPTFLGTGQINSSSLAARINLPTGNQPTDVCAADLDEDGRPDLVVADSWSGGISIYQNISTNGTLAFTPRLVLPIMPGPCCNPTKIVVSDLDGDGRPDIIALNGASNLVSILRNISSPGILSTNSFASRIDISTGNDPWGMAVQDLNGDGKPDIVVDNYNDNTISILQNLSTVGNISFAPRVNYPCGNGPNGLVIGDLDRDGNPDIAVANSPDSTISIFRNLGANGSITTNSFAKQVVFATPPHTAYVTIGDLDGDGKPDMIASCGVQVDTISVFRNISSGAGITTNSFAPHVDFPLPGWGFNTALGDLDGDGKVDLAVVGQLNDFLSLFHNASTPGSFTTSSLSNRVDFAAGYNPRGIVIEDLNGDGKPDVVTVNQYDSNISIYLNTVPTPTPPIITGEPQDQYVDAYGTASFNVTATGASSYQWLFNGSNILNATSSTLTLSNVEQSNLGPYSAVVANNYGAVTSSIANLYMYPAIITPFTGVVANWGQNTTLSIQVWGSGTLTYQWYDNGFAIADATNSTLTFSALQFTNAGLYSVVVSSSLGSVTNAPAQLVVNAAGVSLGMYPGVTVTGTVGYTYIIQSNPDLTNTNGWTTVANLTLFQPIQLWVDVNNNAASPTNQHRFYRVLPSP